MLFSTSSHFFCVVKIAVNVPFFTRLELVDLKTEVSFNEKTSFMWSREITFKNLSNTIVRNFEFLWCTKTKLSDFS